MLLIIAKSVADMPKRIQCRFSKVQKEKRERERERAERVLFVKNTWHVPLTRVESTTSVRGLVVLVSK